MLARIRLGTYRSKAVLSRCLALDDMRLLRDCHSGGDVLCCRRRGPAYRCERVTVPELARRGCVLYSGGVVLMSSRMSKCLAEAQVFLCQKLEMLSVLVTPRVPHTVFRSHPLFASHRLPAYLFFPTTEISDRRATTPVTGDDASMRWPCTGACGPQTCASRRSSDCFPRYSVESGCAVRYWPIH